ncbi:MAG TPA: hypothetical protein VL574_11450 [Stellaceae bacterium]|jgi:anti-sigma factor RsiW|nr:hypothetical protein [Stellaceae bacterium]
MQQQDDRRDLDERLVAFLDGEADEAEQAAIIALQETDPAIRTRLERLAQATELARGAFDDVLDEPVPAHLLALGRAPAEAEPASSSAIILPFRRRKPKPKQPGKAWRLGRLKDSPLAGIATIAAMCVLTIGLTVSIFGNHIPYQPVDPDMPMATDMGSRQVASANAVAPDTGLGSAGWMDTVAGYHNLFISSARGAENTVFDVTPHTENALPGDVRVPNLGVWGLEFQGARRIVLDGKPAFQFFYRPDQMADRQAGTTPATDSAGGITHTSAQPPAAKPPAGNKPVGSKTAAGKAALPVTLFVTTGEQSFDRPERPPTFQHRDNVNLTYWRHRGHGYALVGQADKGWMFSVANDIAYQTGAH